MDDPDWVWDKFPESFRCLQQGQWNLKGFGEMAIYKGTLGGRGMCAKFYTCEGVQEVEGQIVAELNAVEHLPDVGPLVIRPLRINYTVDDSYVLFYRHGGTDVHDTKHYTWCQKDKQLQLEWAKKLAACGALALKALHQVGWVHRDIKLENLVVDNPFDINRGLIRLIDLGLAHALNCHPDDWQMGFTRLYMPPEIAAVFGNAAEQRAATTTAIDIYLLALALVVLLVGDMPKELTNPYRAAMCPPSPDQAAPATATYMQAVASYTWGPWLQQHIADRHMCDMLTQMLALDPATRPTADQLLSHPAMGDWVTRVTAQVEECAESTVAWEKDLRRLLGCMVDGLPMEDECMGQQQQQQSELARDMAADASVYAQMAKQAVAPKVEQQQQVGEEEDMGEGCEKHMQAGNPSSAAPTSSAAGDEHNMYVQVYSSSNQKTHNCGSSASGRPTQDMDLVPVTPARGSAAGRGQLSPRDDPPAVRQSPTDATTMSKPCTVPSAFLAGTPQDLPSPHQLHQELCGCMTQQLRVLCQLAAVLGSHLLPETLQLFKSQLDVAAAAAGMVRDTCAVMVPITGTTASNSPRSNSPVIGSSSCGDIDIPAAGVGQSSSSATLGDKQGNQEVHPTAFKDSSSSAKVPSAQLQRNSTSSSTVAAAQQVVNSSTCPTGTVMDTRGQHVTKKAAVGASTTRSMTRTDTYPSRSVAQPQRASAVLIPYNPAPGQGMTPELYAEIQRLYNEKYGGARGARTAAAAAASDGMASVPCFPWLNRSPKPHAAAGAASRGGLAPRFAAAAAGPCKVSSSKSKGLKKAWGKVQEELAGMGRWFVKWSK